MNNVSELLEGKDKSPPTAWVALNKVVALLKEETVDDDGNDEDELEDVAKDKVNDRQEIVDEDDSDKD